MSINFPIRMENLSTKYKGEIGKTTNFRLGFNQSSIINSQKVKDKAVIYLVVKSDDLATPFEIPKILTRTPIIHGRSAKTAIFNLEENGFYLYGDITGITEFVLHEAVYS